MLHPSEHLNGPIQQLLLFVHSPQPNVRPAPQQNQDRFFHPDGQVKPER